MDLFDIGELVRQRRKDLGMTQAELAERTGMGRVRINQFETGNALDMRFSSVAAILEELGLSFQVGPSRDRRPVFEEIRQEVEDETPGLG